MGAAGVRVFAGKGDGSQIRLRVRTFAPGEGVPEDPVYGSGNGSVTAFLDRHKHPQDSHGSATNIAQPVAAATMALPVYAGITPAITPRSSLTPTAATSNRSAIRSQPRPIGADQAAILANRLRYSAGVTPTCHAKARRRVSASAKPQCAATCFGVS